MRTPKNAKSQVPVKNTVGGHAYERVQQERASRGLDDPPSPPAPTRPAELAKKPRATRAR